MLVYSFGGAMIFRALMCLAPVAALALGALIICAFALASASLVKQAAVHKYAPPGTSANASSFFHVALNIGGVLAGLLIDLTKARSWALRRRCSWSRRSRSRSSAWSA